MPDINALIANQQIGNTGAAAAANRTLDLQQTWNNAGTTFQGLFFNVTDTASAAASLVFDYQIGAVSKLSFRKDSYLIFGSNNAVITPFSNELCFGSTSAYTVRVPTTGAYTGLNVGTSGMYLWANAGGAVNAPDTGLARNAAAVPEVNNGTKGSYTGTALRLGTQTIAQLPAAATAGSGARATVSDALAPSFGATVAAGGAIVTPVYSDGSNWKVG